MTPAMAYLRVSGRSQVEGDGFERQERAIDAYCAASGIVVKHIYREEGVSGALEGMDRPAWVEMIAAILANGVKTIVVERLDRLARDLMIQEHIIADVKRRGITLISAAEPDLCVDDPSRKLMRQIMGAIAEYDKTMIVLKLKAARKRIRDRGERCDGAKPYGELPGEDFILDRMKYAASMGNSAARIAFCLNAEGRKPRRGARWHPHAVKRILDRHSRNYALDIPTPKP
jgi:DNA invertase Pin-like site-specific DNA recombinase